MPLLDYPAPLSAAFLPAIEAVAAAAFGGQLLPERQLAARVRELSEIYTRGRQHTPGVQGEPGLLQARLRFYLPRDLPKVQEPLRELAAVAALPRRRALRVLDVGAGLGASGLGAAAYLLQGGLSERVELTALDRDPHALSLYTRLVERLTADAGMALRLRALEADVSAIEQRPLSPPYDLIVAGFVLNEIALPLPPAQALERCQRLLLHLSSLLSDDGALVVLEPALFAQARALQAVRDRIAALGQRPYVFAPCLHHGSCPMLRQERDWCHERMPLRLPESLGRLAQAAGLRQSHLSFSYLTLHAQPRSLAELSSGVVPLRVVSAARKSKGKLELLLCRDAHQLLTLRRLDRKASAANRAVERAGRGDVLALPESPAGTTLPVDAQTAVALLYERSTTEGSGL